MNTIVIKVITHMEAAHEPYFMNGWVSEFAIKSAMRNGWFRPLKFEDVIAGLSDIGYILHPASPKRGYYGRIFIKRDSQHVAIVNRSMMTKQFLRDQGFNV